MPRTWPSLTIVAVLAIAGPTSASAHTAAPTGALAHYEKTYYIQPSQVDLNDLLAPPPALGSPEEKADLESVMQAQKDRDADDVVDAEADHERSVFRFADVMGANFKTEKLPFTTKFFFRVFSDEAKTGSAPSWWIRASCRSFPRKPPHPTRAGTRRLPM
jgi:acid phosphatase (class A)